MIRVKENIPDLNTLTRRVGEVFETGIVDFISNTKERRKIVLKNRRYFVLAVSAFLFSSGALFLAYNYLQGSLLNLVTMYLLGLAVAAIIFSHRWYREQKALAEEFNLALVPTITACFDRLTLYTHDKVHAKETEAMLRESELLSTFDSATADDMYTFYEPYPISVRELFVTRREQRGKSSVSKTLFHGVFVQVELNKTLSGITFVSTEGDKGNFGHSSFWTGIIDTHGVKETTLEWNEFEKDLHVATNDEIEARYILTPNFMIHLHTWWSEHKENIRIVFKGNKMFILLPDVGIKIASSTTSTEPEKLKEYALSVLKPLWRTLVLVEDIRL